MMIRTIPESIPEALFLAAAWVAGHKFLPAHVARDVADVLGYNLGLTTAGGWVRLLPTVVHVQHRPAP